MSEASGLSKSAKKNRSRKAKKNPAPGHVIHAGEDLSTKDILEKLKDELEIAKQNKLHDHAGKLRDQIWVLTDLIAGVRTNIPDREMHQILQSISGIQSEVTETAETPKTKTSNQTPEEKRMERLKKNLIQIKKLKKRHEKGDKLEKNQIERIESEQSVRDEIKELEELLASAMVDIKGK